MPKYTVIGYYEDTGQSFCEWLTARDEYAAMNKIAKDNVGDGNTTLCIIGVIPGKHTLTTPGEDNGKSAFVEDLAVEL